MALVTGQTISWLDDIVVIIGSSIMLLPDGNNLVCDKSFEHHGSADFCSFHSQQSAFSAYTSGLSLPTYLCINIALSHI
jgi:hypothetical protein